MCLRVLRDAATRLTGAVLVKYLFYSARVLIGCKPITTRLTDVIRLNFFELARAAFFSKYYILVRGTRYEVARAGLIHKQWSMTRLFNK